jgi:uncharacterized protein YdhG (YjbR/CyaY superfamily)
MPGPPPDVADYYAAQPSPHRETLVEMRDRILAVLPTASERIKYQMPTFVYEGRDVCGLMAHKNHIGYYPHSGSVLSQFPTMLDRYGGTKSAIHVLVDKPFPKAVVRALLKARLAQPD